MSEEESKQTIPSPGPIRVSIPWKTIGVYVLTFGGVVGLVGSILASIPWADPRFRDNSLLASAVIALLVFIQVFFNNLFHKPKMRRLEEIKNAEIARAKAERDLAKTDRDRRIQALLEKSQRTETAIANGLHEVNHFYRNSFFDREARGSSPQQIYEEQQHVIETVLGEIERIFSEGFGVSVVATVKHVTLVQGKEVATTFARGCLKTVRDHQDRNKSYLVEENTAFDVARRLQKNGKYCFYSANLDKYPNYKNRRDEWRSHYVSALVVPIQCRGRRDDLVGFLCVDTLEPDKLNDSSHLAILAAFADQMYNFLTISRWLLSLSSEQIEQNLRSLRDQQR